MNELNTDRLNTFCNQWLSKAERIEGESIDAAVDKFITLWIIYNRLYEEAARIMMHENCPLYTQHLKRRTIHEPPPDFIAATKGVIEYCGNDALLRAIDSNTCARTAKQFMIAVIESREFYFYENKKTGAPDEEKDKTLSDAIKNDCVFSLLNLLYKTRCNLFHGQKNLFKRQRELLLKMSSILTVLIEVTQNKLTGRIHI